MTAHIQLSQRYKIRVISEWANATNTVISLISPPPIESACATNTEIAAKAHAQRYRTSPAPKRYKRIARTRMDEFEIV
jgi:hypothetical protein